MKRLAFVLGSLTLACTQAMALNASSLKLTVSAVMLSTSPLCTSPVTVFSGAGAEMEFLSTPTLGSGSPPDATYHCVIIRMTDQIKFTPSSSEGSCVAGREYVNDVCRTTNAGSTRAPDAAGAATACTGTDTTPSSDTVYMYLTTNPSAGTASEPFLQPTSTSSGNGLFLSAPLVVSGTTRSAFLVNSSGKVTGAFSSCGMNPPAFGFERR